MSANVNSDSAISCLYGGTHANSSELKHFNLAPRCSQLTPRTVVKIVSAPQCIALTSWLLWYHHTLIAGSCSALSPTHCSHSLKHIHSFNRGLLIKEGITTNNLSTSTHISSTSVSPSSHSGCSCGSWICSDHVAFRRELSHFRFVTICSHTTQHITLKELLELQLNTITFV